MKRFITCAALLLVTSAVVVTAVRERSVLRADDEARVTARLFQTEYRPRNDLPADDLRQQYVERLKAKAELMSDEEIKAALETTDKEIRDLEAEKRLKDVSNALASIMADCEGTRAAGIAEVMLQVYKNRHETGFGTDPFTPPQPTKK